MNGRRNVTAGDGAMPIRDGEPREGFYMRTRAPGGAFVPAKIWFDDGDRDPETGELMSDQVLRCEVDGKPADPYDQWLRLAKHPITEAKYRFMVADAAWCREHAPDEPKAQPFNPIDPNRTRPVF